MFNDPVNQIKIFRPQSDTYIRPLIFDRINSGLYFCALLSFPPESGAQVHGTFTLFLWTQRLDMARPAGLFSKPINPSLLLCHQP